MTDARTPKRRSRPLRVERSDALLFVTSRTVEERFWLHPLLSCAAEPRNRKARRALAQLDRRCLKRYVRLAREANRRSGPYTAKLSATDVQRIARGLAGAALARVQQERHFELFAFVVLSNHFHMVIRTPDKNAAAIMRDFKSLLTKTLNRITGRRGPLWARRADIQPVLGDQAAAGRVAYCVDNPRKAHLVRDPEQWPGLNLCFGLTDPKQLSFEYFDAVAWHASRRPKQLGPFFKAVTLKLSPLPSADGADRKAYAKDVRRWVASRVGTSAAEHRGDAREASQPEQSFLGADAVLQAAFDQRPKSASRRRRPYCFGTPQQQREHFVQMSATQATHSDSSERYRAGERTIAFPPGTYPPPITLATAA